MLEIKLLEGKLLEGKLFAGLRWLKIDGGDVVGVEAYGSWSVELIDKLEAVLVDLNVVLELALREILGREDWWKMLMGLDGDGLEGLITEAGAALPKKSWPEVMYLIPDITDNYCEAKSPSEIFNLTSNTWCSWYHEYWAQNNMSTHQTYIMHSMSLLCTLSIRLLCQFLLIICLLFMF